MQQTLKQEQKQTIAFFLPSLAGAGAERNVVNLLKALSRQKYHLSVVVGNAQGRFLRDIPADVPVVNLGTCNLVGLFFAFVRYFRRARPALFVSAFPHVNSVSVAASMAARSSTKLVLTEHTVFSLLPRTARTLSRRLAARWCLPWALRALYPKAAAVICVSKGVADDLAQYTGKYQLPTVIYNPVTDESLVKLAHEPVDHVWFSEMTSKKKIPVVLAVGRLIKAKDYPTLLRAFKLVLKQQPARLVILGEGPEKEKLEKLAHHLTITENIALLGFQENPYGYMRRATVFALSSVREGFGDVLVEAMACGTPVVATHCKSGPGEIIQHGKNGLLVPVNDEKKLAAALLKVLENTSLRQALVSAGTKRAADFSITKSVKHYERVFDTL